MEENDEGSPRTLAQDPHSEAAAGETEEAQDLVAASAAVLREGVERIRRLSTTIPAGSSVEAMHQGMALSWGLLELQPLAHGAHSSSSFSLSPDFYDVDNLGQLPPFEAVDRAIQNAATEWEELDLEFGLNVFESSKGGLKRLPPGFDLNLPSNPELFKAAIRVRKSRPAQKDSLQGMVAAMDWDEYRKRLSLIFSSVPFIGDLTGAAINTDPGPVGTPGEGLQIESLQKSIDKMATVGKKCFSSRFQHSAPEPGKRVLSSGFGSSQGRRLAGVVGNAARAAAVVDPVLEIRIYSRKGPPRLKSKGTQGESEDDEGEHSDAVDEDEDESNCGSRKNKRSGAGLNEKLAKRTCIPFRHTQTLVVRGSTLLEDLFSSIRCFAHRNRREELSVRNESFAVFARLSVFGELISNTFFLCH